VARLAVVLPAARALTHRAGRITSLPPVLKKVLRRGGIAVAALCVLGGVGYVVKTQLLDGDDGGDAGGRAPLSVTVLRPGSYAASHPYAPYYVVPRKRFKDPSKLTRVARNKLLTKPDSTLSKGALAGSPQIVRLSLRATSGRPVKVEGVRYTIVSDARPLKGWYTALPGCMVKPVRRAKLDLDAKRPSVRYVGADKRSSRTLGFEVARGRPQIIELQAATRRHRVAWTAQLALRDAGGHTSTVTVDDAGKPFRVTSRSSSSFYSPIYGRSGIIGYNRVRPRLNAC
jgi:hypothetical protein